MYGATAGAAFDACYYQACDTTNNLNPAAMAELSDAAAHAVYSPAMTRTGFFPDGSLRAAARRSAAKAPRATHPIR
ncbi:hypothetical protein [Actinoplanes regularis]|uniref:Uncharacterized protein n=1 Tax=Actinoplanes regularis TaxID=52697 RepID=A0A239J2T9_9ACTN|nr:hypothetical protein [Actinoplanes regularis]GIE89720.1 hypothetical protein Are01nite_62000 [Actinoplanes regularis]SNT00366.1 hypothetical protein SAMN06264365_13251 [Actinoplanes regularis]